MPKGGMYGPPAADRVITQKFVEQASPDVSGRKKVAHGVSRG
ncbi:MAG: hypothetical protein ACLQVM_27695 [Terriglobia bacterium]